jgi:hypothetical protein
MGKLVPSLLVIVITALSSAHVQAQETPATSAPPASLAPVAEPAPAATPAAPLVEPAPSVAPAEPPAPISAPPPPAQPPAPALLLAPPPPAPTTLADLYAPTLAETLDESARADLWIDAMERAESKRRSSARWGSVLASGALAAVAGVGLGLDIFDTKSANIVLGSSLAPFAASMALGIFLHDERQAAAWAATSFALGTVAMSVSLGLGGFAGDETREDRLYSAFVGTALATQALSIIPLAFMDLGSPRREYDNYRSLPRDARAKAASRLLIASDRAARQRAGVVLLSSALILGTLGVGAGLTEKPDLLLYGIPSLTSLVSGLLPLLFNPSRLELFLEGEVPAPGVFRF